MTDNTDYSHLGDDVVDSGHGFPTIDHSRPQPSPGEQAAEWIERFLDKRPTPEVVSVGRRFQLDSLVGSDVSLEAIISWLSKDMAMHHIDRGRVPFGPITFSAFWESSTYTISVEAQQACITVPSKDTP